jgi:FixJ family two-component response regulator
MNKQGTVFLVDDEPAVVRALARLLRAEGYRTETFNSGRDFMDRYRPGGSDCLVLDLSMPGVSGLDVQQWLTDSGHPLPTIFLTAHADFPEQIQTRMDQAAGFLTKPVSASTLVKAIEDALKIHGVDQALPT